MFSTREHEWLLAIKSHREQRQRTGHRVATENKNLRLSELRRRHKTSRFSLVAAYRDRIWKCPERRGCAGTRINVEDNFPRAPSRRPLRKTRTDIAFPVSLSVNLPIIITDPYRIMPRRTGIEFRNFITRLSVFLSVHVILSLYVTPLCE